MAIPPGSRLVHWEWDVHGQQWAVLESQSLQRLATATVHVERTLGQRGFGSLQNWSVFALLDGTGRAVQLAYDHRQRGFYPFIPGPGRTRDEAAEQQLATGLSTMLPVVPDPAQWAALWDSPLLDTQ